MVLPTKQQILEIINKSLSGKVNFYRTDDGKFKFEYTDNGTGTGETQAISCQEHDKIFF